MTDKLAPIVPKLLPLLRMLGSGADGEIVNSVRAIRRILESSGADIHALVERIEKPAPASNELLREFERGRAAGRAQGSTPANYGNESGGVGQGINGYPWKQIGEYLRDNAWRMSGFERQFCEGHRGALSIAEHPASRHHAPHLRQPFRRRDHMIVPPINHARSRSDRAGVVAVAVMQIVRDARLRPFEAQLRLAKYLRDEFADLEWQIANGREVYE